MGIKNWDSTETLIELWLFPNAAGLQPFQDLLSQESLNMRLAEIRP
jgi:hypothetical protein